MIFLPVLIFRFFLWLTESEQATPVDSIKDVVRSSVKVPEFDKHLKKAGGHIGRNVAEITIKMKTIVRKPLMIKANISFTKTTVWEERTKQTPTEKKKKKKRKEKKEKEEIILRRIMIIDFGLLLVQISEIKLDDRYDYWPHRTIDLIFIVILTTFRPICSSAFFMCFMSNSAVHRNFELNPSFETSG